VVDGAPEAEGHRLDVRTIHERDAREQARDRGKLRDEPGHRREPHRAGRAKWEVEARYECRRRPREIVLFDAAQRLRPRPLTAGGRRLEPDAPRLRALAFPYIRDARPGEEAIEIGLLLPDAEESPFAEVR